MKQAIMIFLICLLFPALCDARTNKEVADESKEFYAWFKSEKSKSEAYFIPSGAVLCTSESSIVAMHNQLLIRGGNISKRWLREVDCRMPKQYSIARIMEIKDISVHVEYVRHINETAYVYKVWVHSGHLELLSEYQKRFR